MVGSALVGRELSEKIQRDFGAAEREIDAAKRGLEKAPRASHLWIFDDVNFVGLWFYRLLAGETSLDEVSLKHLLFKQASGCL